MLTQISLCIVICIKKDDLSHDYRKATSPNFDLDNVTIGGVLYFEIF